MANNFATYDLNPLAKYSDDELKAELRRRTQERKKESSQVKRCHQCEHWGSVDYWGKLEPDGHAYANRSPKSDRACCPFQKTKNGKYNRCMPAYTLACEHFSKDCQNGIV